MSDEQTRCECNTRRRVTNLAVHMWSTDYLLESIAWRMDWRGVWIENRLGSATEIVP